MIKELRMMPKKAIYDVRNELNLSEDESKIFDMLMKKKSIQQIADDVCMSTRTVNRKVQSIECQLVYMAQLALFEKDMRPT